jgi:hypothetical protein
MKALFLDDRFYHKVGLTNHTKCDKVARYECFVTGYRLAFDKQACLPVS